MKWTLKIFEYLLRKAPDQELDELEKSALKRQLREDEELRHLAIEMARMIHEKDSDLDVSQDPKRAEDLRNTVMEQAAIVLNQENSHSPERQLRKAPQFGLVPAMALAAALAIMILFVSKPNNPQLGMQGQAAEQIQLEVIKEVPQQFSPDTPALLSGSAKASDISPTVKTKKSAIVPELP